MAMDDHITKMGYIIFTISILAAGLIPVAWNILGGQASLVEATSNSTSQTLSRDLFGTSGGTFSNASYTPPQLSVIPGHLDQISTATFTPGTFPLRVTLTGYGFGSTAPSSGQVNGKPAVSMVVGGQSFDSTSGITIASWSDSQIVFTLPSSFTQNPSGAISFSVYSTSNQNLATYTLNVPVVTVGNIQNTYVNGSTTITGNVQSPSGSAITNEPVVLTITAPGGSTQTVNTTTDGNGNFTTPYTPTQMGGYMVKAECEDGVSNLYEKSIALGSSVITFQTSMSSYAQNGGAIYLDEVNSNSSPSIAPGEYDQFTYTAMSGYKIANFFSTMNGDIDSTSVGNAAIYFRYLMNGTPTNNTNISYTAGSSLPLEFSPTTTSNTLIGGWQAAQTISAPFAAGMSLTGATVFLTPMASSGTNTGGTFGVFAPKMEITSFSGTTFGQPTSVTFHMSFDGNPITGVNINSIVYYSAGFNDWVPINVINSNGQSVSNFSGTTDSNGNVTFSYTVPNSYPSGTGILIESTGGDSIAGTSSDYN